MINCPVCNVEVDNSGKAHNKTYCSRKCKDSKAGQRLRDLPIEERRRVRPSNHTANVYKNQKVRGISRKLEIIQSKGGCCEICGYKQNIAALAFHHIDPSVKEMKLDMRTLSNNKMELLLEEASKCMLVCHNCHMELHHPTYEGLL